MAARLRKLDFPVLFLNRGTPAAGGVGACVESIVVCEEESRKIGVGFGVEEAWRAGLRGC